MVTKYLRCAKALDRGSARLCCLAKDCDNPEYTQLVRALCDEGNVHLIMVSINQARPFTSGERNAIECCLFLADGAHVLEYCCTSEGLELEKTKNKVDRC